METLLVLAFLLFTLSLIAGLIKPSLVIRCALFLTNQTDRDIYFVVSGGLSFSFSV